ncbi:MAG: hypothetical protein ACLP50_21300 [Solirubrobacteraceae bacterium]
MSGAGSDRIWAGSDRIWAGSEFDGSAVAKAGAPPGLPERASVPWRARVDDASLRRLGRRWTICTAWHTAPMIVSAALLVALAPVATPVAIVLLAHAWIIPELYAARGAGVLRSRAPSRQRAERRALLLLGDLIDDRARRLHEASGLVLERGELGAWIIGERGAVLVRPGARRVNCYCVKATASDLPTADRIAHLLLALRCDERDFATVANVAFSGACWRLRRRLRPEHRQALDAARHLCSRSRSRRAGGAASRSALAAHARGR